MEHRENRPLSRLEVCEDNEELRNIDFVRVQLNDSPLRDSTDKEKDLPGGCYFSAIG